MKHSLLIDRLRKGFQRNHTPKLRQASKEDYDFITEIVFGALDMPYGNKGQMNRACLQDDTLYSWANTTLLCVGKEIIGGIIAYPGKKYPKMKKATWNNCWDIDIDEQENECDADEFYIDSLYLLPEYRRQNYGVILMRNAEEKAVICGMRKISLLVDKDKDGLVEYYKREGFVISGNKTFLSKDNYYKMTKRL